MKNSPRRYPRTSVPESIKVLTGKLEVREWYGERPEKLVIWRDLLKEVAELSLKQKEDSGVRGENIRCLDVESFQSLVLTEFEDEVFFIAVSDKGKEHNVWIDIEVSLSADSQEEIFDRITDVLTVLDYFASPRRIGFRLASEKLRPWFETVKEEMKSELTGRRSLEDRQILEMEQMAFTDRRRLEFKSLLQHCGGDKIRAMKKRRSLGLYPLPRELDLCDIEEAVLGRIYASREKYVEEVKKQNQAIRFGVIEKRVFKGVMAIASGCLESEFLSPEEIVERMKENHYKIKFTMTELLEAMGYTRDRLGGGGGARRMEIIERVDRALRNLRNIRFIGTYGKGGYYDVDLIWGLKIDEHRGRGVPIYYRVGIIPDIFREDFLKSYIVRPAEVRRISTKWEGISEWNLWDWLARQPGMTVVARVDTLIEVLGLQRRRMERGVKGAVERMEQIFEMYEQDAILLNWRRLPGEKYVFLKNWEAFGRPGARSFALRRLLERRLRRGGQRSMDMLKRSLL